MLSFPLPFGGTDYTSVWVGTNGGLQLDDLGDAGDIDYDYWSQLQDFYADGGYPLILPSEADRDLSTTGTIRFKDSGDRAVFTWNEVVTDAEEEHLSTFQIQLFPDGRIYFSHNGILDGPDEDLVDSLGEGIVVGISGSTGTDPGPVDLSNRNETGEDTVYERWNDPDTPANSLFDLDNETPGVRAEGWLRRFRQRGDDKLLPVSLAQPTASLCHSCEKSGTVASRTRLRELIGAVPTAWVWSWDPCGGRHLKRRERGDSRRFDEPSSFHEFEASRAKVLS